MNARPDFSNSNFSLGQISVGKEIGSGGCGVVNEARIEGIDVELAIKFLDPAFANGLDGSMQQRFVKEAEALFKLRHPHIIAIYGVGMHEGTPYILMEKFRGNDLQTVVEKKGKPKPNSIFPFLIRVADGLRFAHNNGIVHRDIKPKNLMTVKGDARILDFGIASRLDPKGTRLTRTGGTFVGDAFSAPELNENPRLVDQRCDIFSFILLKEWQ